MTRQSLLTFVTALFGLVAGMHAVAQPIEFAVQHDHLFGSGAGRLVIQEDGIGYQSKEDEEHARFWSFTDIQELRIEPAKLEILTYEDQPWRLGRDRRFEFRVLGEAMTPGLVRRLRKHLPLRVVSTLATPPENETYSVPVKHRHALGGGCEGQLLFGDQEISFQSDNPDHSRNWPLQMIQSLGRESEFSLRIRVREENLLGEARNFRFQLKQRLDPDIYELFWRKIHEPKSWLDPATPAGPLVHAFGNTVTFVGSATRVSSRREVAVDAGHLPGRAT